MKKSRLLQIFFGPGLGYVITPIRWYLCQWSVFEYLRDCPLDFSDCMKLGHWQSQIFEKNLGWSQMGKPSFWGHFLCFWSIPLKFYVHNKLTLSNTSRKLLGQDKSGSSFIVGTRPLFFRFGRLLAFWCVFTLCQ